MANEDTALREVDQELAEERQWALFQKHGPVVIAAAIGVVVMVGGWQFWNSQKEATAKKDALEYRNAIEVLTEDAEAGRQALSALAEDGSGGYSVLARLQEGASYARNGERLAALAAYRDVAANGTANKRIRELARLRAAYLSLPDGRDAVLAELGNLPDDESLNGYYAREISALAALNAKDYETAHAMFERASIDLGAPEALRSRAEEFAALAASGRAGVNITGETQLEDLVDAISGAVDGGAIDPALEDHSGHDHGDEALLDGEAELTAEPSNDDATAVEEVAETSVSTTEENAEAETTEDE